MIRRELQLTDAEPIWLFISQVDHARVSGEIVALWKEPFTPEVVEGIVHHDDGWAEWEAAPKFNPEIGAPYSFLEMPISDALVVWDSSIAAARKFGPLAGYIVAGHFYNLLADSDRANEPAAIAWLTAKRKVRTAWLDEWVRNEKPQSLDYAKQSQQMLLTADLFSLWLCCDCPVEEVTKSILNESAMKLRTDALMKQFHFGSPECTIRESLTNRRVEGLSWLVPIEPYPCRTSPLTLTINAKAAPVSHYGTWQELLAASWPFELIWSLISEV
jgi:hypothetical protein